MLCYPRAPAIQRANAVLSNLSKERCDALPSLESKTFALRVSVSNAGPGEILLCTRSASPMEGLKCASKCVACSIGFADALKVCTGRHRGTSPFAWMTGADLWC